jgi:hypothetical protein
VDVAIINVVVVHHQTDYVESIDNPKGIAFPLTVDDSESNQGSRHHQNEKNKNSIMYV